MGEMRFEIKCLLRKIEIKIPLDRYGPRLEGSVGQDDQ
jgi:hypothetical protein